MNILNSQPQEVVYLDIKKNVKQLSRSKSTNPPTKKGSNNSLIRRNSSNDTILAYLDKELPPPPPYSDSLIDDPNSTTITTTTTTTTVTTVTTTTISNSGESTSKQQNPPDMNPSINDSNDSEIPSITIVSYESSCDTSKDETEIITPSISIPPDNEISSENSNPVYLNDGVKSQRRHIRSGSAPNVHTLLFKEQTDDLKYKKNTIPSASSMVHLPDSRRDTVFLNNSYKETPQQYLDKLRDTLSKSELATLLTKSKDVFHETVLRTYMETFDFTRDPVDIALRLIFRY
ncbi:3716_t:CDS:1 [Funneliformis mosseae]|uniref:3716_t:CDS:1 n=1 Tax=Funneliformis mosseae TaxID=27381 RepID=A0A9N9G1S1_FUNMO|nr:3716_t:CDS:1 [Funneliformis mosseae]